MNTAGQNTKQGMEESDMIKQFMELLSQQDMGYRVIINYVH